ncbi:hypothetical protein CBR_g84230, partial [Chara braunii]
MEIRSLINVVNSVVPLYVAILLGYLSTTRWKYFTMDQFTGMNNLNSIFLIPLYILHYLANTDLRSLSAVFILADTCAKFFILIFLWIWIRYLCTAGNPSERLEWLITSFMIATSSNLFIVGLPLMDAMYGPESGGYVAQIAIMDVLLWSPLYQVICELVLSARKKEEEVTSTSPSEDVGSVSESDCELPRKPKSQTVTGTVIAIMGQADPGMGPMGPERGLVSAGDSVRKPTLARVSDKATQGARTYSHTQSHTQSHIQSHNRSDGPCSRQRRSIQAQDHEYHGSVHPSTASETNLAAFAGNGIVNGQNVKGGGHPPPPPPLGSSASPAALDSPSASFPASPLHVSSGFSLTSSPLFSPLPPPDGALSTVSDWIPADFSSSVELPSIDVSTASSAAAATPASGYGIDVDDNKRRGCDGQSGGQSSGRRDATGDRESVDLQKASSRGQT